ncbi:hypothetical protein K8R61_02195 [bacterium]|nr:hypothetical protein [bacterium]
MKEQTIEKSLGEILNIKERITDLNFQRYIGLTGTYGEEDINIKDINKKIIKAKERLAETEKALREP